MKGLIKLETLRSKLAEKIKPSNHEFRMLVTGAQHHVEGDVIDEMIHILNEDNKANVKWLKERKKAFAPKPKSK